MRRLHASILAVFALLLVSTGGARWAHELVAHSAVAETAHACGHDHGHEHGDRDDRAPEPRDTDQDCPVCVAITAAGKASIGAGGTSVVPVPDAPSYLTDLPERRVVGSALLVAQPRGPPALAA